MFADVDGKRVYFCCPGCDKKFLEDAKANVKKMEAEGITLAVAQTACPMSGKKINPKKHTELADGRTVYFCCGSCQAKFEKDPEKYLDGEDNGHAHAH